jgi:hypothetical protein
MFVVIESADFTLAVEYGAKLLEVIFQACRLDVSSLFPTDDYYNTLHLQVMPKSREWLRELDFDNHEKRVHDQLLSGVRSIFAFHYYQMNVGSFKWRVNTLGRAEPNLVFYLGRNTEDTDNFIAFANRNRLNYHCILVDENEKKHRLPVWTMFSKLIPLLPKLNMKDAATLLSDEVNRIYLNDKEGDHIQGNEEQV